jgi:hypothetical protein
MDSSHVATGAMTALLATTLLKTRRIARLNGR